MNNCTYKWIPRIISTLWMFGLTCFHDGRYRYEIKLLNIYLYKHINIGSVSMATGKSSGLLNNEPLGTMASNTIIPTYL
ncbi:hypothetical protein [Candidatus Hodgkinia cicadicola]|uniref:hypothetical protein n=1 Tax=Candidatus Hodgkinia cicadicola TaxID=573658 RepID=UPI001788BFC5